MTTISTDVSSGPDFSQIRAHCRQCSCQQGRIIIIINISIIIIRIIIIIKILLIVIIRIII